MLWTWSDIFHRQLKSGQPFKQVNPTISIWFLDNNLFKEVPDQYHHEFAVMEKQRHELLCDQLNIQIIEMQKWVSGLKSNSDLDAWLQFLNCAQELEIEDLPQPLQKPQIKKAMKTLQRISQSDREHDKYMRRMEYLSVQASLELDREEALDALRVSKEDLKAKEEALNQKDVALSQKEAEKNAEKQRADQYRQALIDAGIDPDSLPN
jgi:hypothetical protein